MNHSSKVLFWIVFTFQSIFIHAQTNGPSAITSAHLIDLSCINAQPTVVIDNVSTGCSSLNQACVYNMSVGSRLLPTLIL